MKNRTALYVLIPLLVALIAFGLAGCSREDEPAEQGDAAAQAQAAPGETAEPFNVAVIVPGVAAGSPIYEQLVEGAERAVAEYDHASMKVVELGFNQAEWAERLTAVVATGTYETILTSNPSMPFVCMDIAEQFPDQKFLFVDGYIDGHPQMASYLYNQREQSYMLGHLAGLITTSSMDGANADLKIGMVVAQEYPALTRMMVPGFLQGAQAVNPDIELDLRIVGNWYDANKAAELARSMVDAGVDVIGVIAGGAATGVFDVATERGKYVMYWDDNAYAAAPGAVAGCGALRQARLVYEVTVAAINGEVEYGTGQVLSTRDGYIQFITDDPNYIATVPEEIRAQQQDVIDAITSGELVLEAPEL